MTAIVEPAPGCAIDPDEVAAAARALLAGYKVPRHVIVSPIGRASNGKADYRALRQRAIDQLAAAP